MRTVYLGLLIFIYLSFLVDFGFTIRWLSIQHSHLHWNLSSMNTNPGRDIRSRVKSPCTIARRMYGFAKVQAKLCRNSMEIMPHVQSAAVLASETCRAVFKERRWNCSSIFTAPFLTPDLTRATREQAYVYAISSAALTYSMARACSNGDLHHCTCASNQAAPPSVQFQWGGCGDNVEWGDQFAKKFIDNVEKSALKQRTVEGGEGEGDGREEIAAVNLHNIRVGRKVVKESLHKQCKCHGVSGSCNIKTCWMALPSMSEMGYKLLKKYTTAFELPILKRRKNRAISTHHTLIYVSKSPDYCTKNEELGSFGTVGRHCNVSSNGPGSCRKLCCGRGYSTVLEEKIERCQCKFYNCCYVKCRICKSMTKIYECL